MIGSYPKRAKRAFLSSFGGKEMFYVLSVIYAAVQLIKSVIVNWRAVSKATSISFYPEGGFGHTIHAPDILRRCHPDGSGIVFFGFSPGRHNPQVPHLFRDVRLILVPVTMALISSDGIKQLPSCVKYTIKLFDWSYRFISIIFPKKMVYNGLELFDRLENPVPDSAGRRFYNFLGYLQLLKTTTAPSIRLPSEMRGSVEELIRKKSESLSRQPSKLCCLYLRDKGGPEHPADQIKSGSEMSEYTKAIKVLVESDFRVLVIGDRHLTDEIKHCFGASVLEADDLDIDADIFNLYAATEADFFLGDSGAGGCWLIFLKNIPSLIVNAYPYFLASPSATMFFKTMFDAEGCSVPVDQLFNKYHSDMLFDGVTVVPNSAAEIEFAVRDFLNRDNEDEVYGVPLNEICDSPNFLWIHHANSKISPAWLKIHEDDGITADEVERRALGYSGAQ